MDCLVDNKPEVLYTSICLEELRITMKNSGYWLFLLRFENRIS